MNKTKMKAVLFGLLMAVFAPVLLLFLLFYIIKPAIQGKVPSGFQYILWILGLVCLGAIFQLPFGSFNTIAEALKKPEVCRAILYAEGIATMLSILLILLTFRNKIPNPYVPLTKFKIDKTIVGLWCLSLLPLSILLSTKTIFRNPDNIIHPLFAALASSLKSGSYISVLIGFLSIGFFAPVLEEIIFRGMLLEDSHEKERSKGMRYFLDFVVCLFFALLHLPVSFIAPLILAAAFIYVRRRSGSLLPSIFMHSAWNSSILIVMLVARQNI
jgi:membrane protease YdiL (CAAX protease family)